MAKINRTMVYNVAIKQFRNLGRDSDGKWRYENALNKTCFDLFGKQGIGTKLSPKSKVGRIEKCISTFDFDSLIGILADDKASHKLRVAVMTRHAISTGKYSGKEEKKIKKAYKKIVESLSDQFRIEKASDDIFAAINSVYDDEDDYDFDFSSEDDNIFSSVWEDDDTGYFGRASRKYGSTARHKNELARLIYGGSKYDDDDDDDLNDDNMAKIINVLENITDRLDNLEAANDDDDCDYTMTWKNPRPNPNRRRRRNVQQYHNPLIDDGWVPDECYDEDDDDYEDYPPPPTPAQINQQKSDDDVSSLMTTMVKAIKETNTTVANMSNALATTSRDIVSMKSDLTATMKNVADLMNDLYGDDSEDAQPPGETPEQVFPIRDSDNRA